MIESLTLPGDVFAEMDRLHQQFEQMFRPASFPASIRAQRRGAFPALNIGNTTEAVEVVAFAPGIEPASLQVSVDKGLLTIAGERKSDLAGAGEGVNVYANERFAGPFRRVVNLPDDADPARVDAVYRDGILRVTVAKRESSKPRRVEIR